MDTTPNLNLPIPNADAVPPTNISQEFPRLADALIMLDAIIHNLQGVVAGKAEANHNQAMSTITGLVEALAAKMPANTTFSLDDLQDVQGAAAALVNYVLVKNASGFWVPSTALAALGVHNHAISEVVGLADLLDDITDELDLLATNKAEKAVTVTGAGLATGGGSLAANRVITVSKATDAEHQARERDDVAATPKGVGLALVAYNKWQTIEDADLSNVGSYIRNGLAGFQRLKLQGRLRNLTNTTGIVMRVSTDNGATFLSSGIYGIQYVGAQGSTDANSNSLTASAWLLSVSSSLVNSDDMVLNYFFENFNQAGKNKLAIGTVACLAGSTTVATNYMRILTSALASGCNALTVFAQSGNLTGELLLEGCP